MRSAGGYQHLRHDPDACVAWLNGQRYHGPTSLRLLSAEPDLTVIDADFGPPPGLPGYPAESARVLVQHPTGQVLAVPLGPSRTWQHRNPAYRPNSIPTDHRCPIELLVAPLCLWDPHDPPALRWRWSAGLGAFIGIVQRHLICEEYHRRHGHWPIEDAPHGTPPPGKRHPLITPAAREAAA